jgi:hypothetical protein
MGSSTGPLHGTGNFFLFKKGVWIIKITQLHTQGYDVSCASYLKKKINRLTEVKFQGNLNSNYLVKITFFI